jgi:glycosyltransferase involved in cell wall biosynthesis
MMSSLPSVSIVIPTYNRSEILERTIRHLLAQRYPAELLEVLLVDNSGDGAPQMIERVAAGAPLPVRLIRTTERLPAVKRNLGLHAAGGDLVLYMNDDVWAEPELVAEHVHAHAEHGAAGPVAVLGLVEQSPEMPPTPFLEFYRPFAYHEIEGRGGRVVPWRYFWSMNLSLPRSAMLEGGLLFHEDWAEIGHEDVELGYRWGAAGRKVVYNPRALGWHYHPHTLESACRLQSSVGRGLRDLEKLIPDPDLLERYGVVSRRSSPRGLVRGLARTALFNGASAPLARRWLESRRGNTALTRWMYWKVLLHYTNHGYRSAPPREPGRVAAPPRVAGGGAV